MPGESKSETEISPPLTEDDRGYVRALLAATVVSAALFLVTIYIWLFSTFDDVIDMRDPIQWLSVLVITFALFLFMLGLGIAAAMLIFDPLLRLLQRTNRFNTKWIMTASFLIGFAVIQISFLIIYEVGPGFEQSRPDFGEWLLGGAQIGAVMGVCCLAGGIVFCRMTIWRKPKLDIGSHDPN